MLTPRPRRPISRTSTTTTSTPTLLDSSPPSSWSGIGTGRMSRSDDGTEMPESHAGDDEDGVTVVGVKEGRLIDFDDDEEYDHGNRQGDVGSDYGTKRDVDMGMSGVEMTPAEKLKLLLRQMEVEVRDTTPAPNRIQARDVEVEDTPRGVQSKRGGWRDGRRRVVTRREEEEVRSEPSSPEIPPQKIEEEEESPPTPPPRITNPYSHTARRISGERDRTPTPPTVPPHRITSRAAVLHASTSITARPASPPSRPRSTPLEHFLATQPNPPPLPPQPIASTSQIAQPHRSVSFSSTSSTRSRKGKERATPSPVQPPPTSRRHPRTPKRWSVELAPDNSALFAQEAEGLEVRGQVELDLEESGEVYWDKSGIEDSVYPNDEEEPTRVDRYTTGIIPPNTRPRSRESTPPVISPQLRNSASSRLTRILSHPTPPPQPPPDVGDTSLPPLPEPESEADDESDSRTSSSRRAGLFRSSPRGPGGANRLSPVSQRDTALRPTGRNGFKDSTQRTEYSYSREEVRFAPPEPVRVGMTFDSTPIKQMPDQTISGNTPHPPGKWSHARSADGVGEMSKGSVTHLTPTRQAGDATISGQTPHPPGKWTAGGGKGKAEVRFSPLRQEVSAEGESALTENTSILRLRVSPSHSKSKPLSTRPSPTSTINAPSVKQSQTISSRSPNTVDPDSSFLTRLKTSISLPSIMSPKKHSNPRLKHRPSQTLREAQQSLSIAAQASRLAQERVELTQRQWVEAITALSKQGGVKGVVRTGWGWGGWAWWVGLELILIWSVFRLTIDYATSASYLSHLDPFSLNHASMAVSIPPPSAISGFLVDHRVNGGINFFDLLWGLQPGGWIGKWSGGQGEGKGWSVPT